jgi:hypothetical protein
LLVNPLVISKIVHSITKVEHYSKEGERIRKLLLKIINSKNDEEEEKLLYQDAETGCSEE